MRNALTGSDGTQFEAVHVLPRRLTPAALLACAWLACWCGAAVAQQSNANPVTSPPAPTSLPSPIPDLEISARAGAARTLARSAEVDALPDSRLAQIQADSTEFQQRNARLLIQAEELLAESGSTVLLREAEKSALRASERLDRWTRDVSLRSTARQSSLQALRAERLLWEATGSSEHNAELPPALQAQVTESLRVLQHAEREVRDARDAALALEAEIGQQQAALESILNRLQREIASRSAAVFEIDSPPLWRAFGANEGKLWDLPQQITEAAAVQWRGLKDYALEEGSSLAIWLILWLGLSAVLAFSRQNLQRWTRKDPALEGAAALFRRPLAGAAVIILVIGNLIDQQAPAAFLESLNLLLLLSVAYLLLGMLPRRTHLSLYLLAPGFVIYHLVNLVPLGSISQRLSIIALAVIGSGFCLAFLSVSSKGRSEPSEALRQFLVRGLYAGLLLYAAGLVSSLLGNMTLGALLVLGTASAIFAAVVLWVVVLLLRVLVRIALVTGLAHRWGIAPEHSQLIRSRMFRMISFVAGTLWVVFALRGFELFEPVMVRINGLLNASLSLGDLALSLGAGLLFAFLVWFSFKLAALTGFVFGELILPRLLLPQGAPHAISRLLRYAVLFVGLLIAMRALGFNLSQAAIVAGGLGVGIGFGLQNVVSNFAAGLILLFERPIRMGDIVELGTTGGVVEKIGMRATLVRTWRGSELIVPNSQLISSDVVNWTLVHNRRRLEVSVGVDYGSDPDMVAQLLIDTAAGHPDIDEHPPPQCLFMGFGDSSLDFQLRAWAEASKCLNLESELRFAIHRSLKQAGITIPFPQRDLHLRSMPPEGTSVLPTP